MMIDWLVQVPLQTEPPPLDTMSCCVASPFRDYFYLILFLTLYFKKTKFILSCVVNTVQRTSTRAPENSNSFGRVGKCTEFNRGSPAGLKLILPFLKTIKTQMSTRPGAQMSTRPGVLL